MIHRRYLEEKLRAAVGALGDEGRPLQERLRSAYVYGLSTLESSAFDPEDRDEFEAINKRLTETGEAREGGGSLETTLFLMSEDDAALLASRILALADRYGQA